MADSTLTRARAGDSAAFEELISPYRRELQLHCYRFLGSFHDAEDVLQETLLAAWQALDRFDGRSPRAWLYRIATNRCLNFVRDASRRPRSPGLPGPASAAPSPSGRASRPGALTTFPRERTVLSPGTAVVSALTAGRTADAAG